jgi:hypothetical protein
LEPTKTQLPATITQADITADQRALNVVPALIADLGDEAGWRCVEFFTANIRNPHTRRAYARACAVGQAVAPGAHGIVLMDKAGWHTAGDLVVPENLSLVFLPPYSPELNPIERL